MLINVLPRKISEAKLPREDGRHLATNQVVLCFSGGCLWSKYSECLIELWESLAKRGFRKLLHWLPLSALSVQNNLENSEPLQCWALQLTLWCPGQHCSQKVCPAVLRICLDGFWKMYCDKNSINVFSQHVWSMQYSVVNYRHIVVQQISRTFSSFITETLYPLNNPYCSPSPWPPLFFILCLGVWLL